VYFFIAKKVKFLYYAPKFGGAKYDNFLHYE